MEHIQSIAKQIAGTTKEKIIHALLKEFIASNVLYTEYNMRKEDIDSAFEEFKEIVEVLPKALRFVKFD